ncbi:pre-rRNA-processing protein TSR1 [Thraustotheca clavata]|uniref:Pre-rRNA-processing protein TSR1 n=1 Tax=Thraustotheca clavata TaxID=74557 RepID=A0A1W0A2K5_9STRA|nr:pre-rRNA-processing protein TSR1 [Thraustotheca clavata]
MSHHHRSGPLKQKNKKHKAGKHDTKTLLTKKSGGKVERVVGKAGKIVISGSKQQRLLKAKQWKQMKHEDVAMRHRLGTLNGPPKIVALVPLGPSANLDAVRNSIIESASNVQYSEDAKMLGRFTHATFATHKQHLSIIECDHDVLGILDMAKVADIIVFVLPMYNGPDAAVSSDGDVLLSAIRAQGIVATVGVIQGLEVHSPKVEADCRKYGQRFFTTEFGESCKIAQGNNNLQVVRAVLTVQPKVLHWREIRSYMHSTTVNYVQENEVAGSLHISGFLRGKPLSVNQLIHLTDIGTYQLSHVLKGDDNTTVLARADPSKQEDLQYEAEVGTFAAEQTWPTEEELKEAAASRKEVQVAGMSSYQAAWNMDGEDAEDDMNMESDNEDELPDQSFCKVGADAPKTQEGDDDEMSLVDQDEDMEYRKAEKEKLQAEHEAFPDEVDIPGDTLGKDRFARYRGMKSFRTSPWDPKESLPIDYARLFQFESFIYTQKRVLDEGKEAEEQWKEAIKKASDESTPLLVGEYIASGAYVTLVLKNVPVVKMQQRMLVNRPFVLSSLLRHENRMSVLNFTIQRHASSSDVVVKSKDPVMFHCGFRRFQGCPIFSDENMKSDKHKFQRFMPSAGWTVATVYGPATFQPASVLAFHSNSLIGSGTLLNVDPDRIMLKRVVIAGTPVRVKKRKAVVRYMFHSPDDVRWFKPVELTTKHGMTGHITESLGTHGDFKAVFNKPIKQHDTVCLNLYKRVYPKRVVQDM